jgi:hypothetical protein
MQTDSVCGVEYVWIVAPSLDGAPAVEVGGVIVVADTGNHETNAEIARDAKVRLMQKCIDP